MPVAEIDPVFMSHINGLANTANTNGNAVLLLAQRDWNTPGTEFGWDGSQLDILGISKAFSRIKINQLHDVVMTTAGKPGGGRIADSKCLKIQADYLAGEERAYRLRHATSVRTSILAANRQIGHGDDNGIFLGGVLRLVQNSLESGYNGGDTGS